jgi:hypothetical protein
MVIGTLGVDETMRFDRRRISEALQAHYRSLRAFRRLTKIEPQARAIRVGEEHPGFGAHADPHSDHRARACNQLRPLEDFVGPMAATDIVLRRYPMSRKPPATCAHWLAKAVIVSGGWLQRIPRRCLSQTPVDATEEDDLSSI